MNARQAQATGSGRSLARRGVLAGVAALVTGVLAKAGERVAQAADGGPWLLGAANSATSNTLLSKTPRDGISEYAVTCGNTQGGGILLQVTGGADFSGLTALNANGAGVRGVSGNNGPATAVIAAVHGTAQAYPGVLGDSTNDTGVLGLHNVASPPAGYYAGVLGVADLGTTAVQGVAGTPGPVPPQGTVGVGGTSSTGYGVVGTSSSNAGVLGSSNNGVGVQGSSNGNVGVLGTSNASVGVYANSLNQYGLYATSPNNYAAIGTSNSGTGVYGASTSNVGVLGTSNSSIGVFGSSSSGTGVYGTGPANGFAARFDGSVQVNGAFTVLGGPKSAAVPHPDGSHRRLYCVESPESWFEDCGRGQLANGQASVRLDQDFAALVHTHDYDVFLTPYGDSKGLYVASKTATGFEVREQQGGTNTLAFGYRVLAKRKDIAGPRLERVNVAPAAQRPAAPVAPPLPPIPALSDHPAPGERPGSR